MNESLAALTDYYFLVSFFDQEFLFRLIFGPNDVRSIARWITRQIFAHWWHFCACMYRWLHTFRRFFCFFFCFLFDSTDWMTHALSIYQRTEKEYTVWIPNPCVWFRWDAATLAIPLNNFMNASKRKVNGFLDRILDCAVWLARQPIEAIRNCIVLLPDRWFFGRATLDPSSSHNKLMPEHAVCGHNRQFLPTVFICILR